MAYEFFCINWRHYWFKKIDNRYQVQKSLESCLADLNNEFQAVLASKLSITLGDEFQGLLSLDAPLFQIIDRINLAMKPYQVRFGIGMGKNSNRH